MNIAIVIAGGVGSRMGLDIPKQFVRVDGKTVLSYTLEGFQTHPLVVAIEVVCIKGWEDVVMQDARTFGITKLKWIVEGGSTGQESIWNGVFDPELTPDYILPLASNIHPLTYSKCPVETIMTNIDGARSAFELACSCGATVLCPSSVEVCGNAFGDDVFAEDIVLKSKGDQYFSYTYSADAVAAMLFVMLNGENAGIYNVANESCNAHLKDSAGICVGCWVKEVIFDLPSETEQKGFSIAMRARLSNEKLIKSGFTPVYGIKTAIEKTAAVLTSKQYIS